MCTHVCIGYIADPIGGLRPELRPLVCWDFGFEFRREHGYLSLAIIVCCQRPLRQADRSSRGVLKSLVCLIECDLGTLTRRKLRPNVAVDPYNIYTQADTHYVTRRNTAVQHFVLEGSVRPSKQVYRIRMNCWWRSGGRRQAGTGAECGQFCHWTWRLADTIQRALLCRNYIYCIPILWIH